MDQDFQPAAVQPPRGFYPGRVDEKGRLKLPVDFQNFLAGLGEKNVFVTSLEGSIGRIYPISEWKQMETLLNAPGEAAKEGQDLLFIANAMGGDAEMDAQGRLLLPAALRKRLSLESETVHMHHVRGHIRFYTDAMYQTRLERAFTGAEDKLDRFEAMGLR